MSLDERLRSGLRTMAEPVQDSERALYAFREKAYPRRTRRRVLESVGTFVAALAIIAGGTAVVRTLSNRPGGYATRPPGIASCTNDNLQIYSGFGYGPAMVIETTITAVRTPCWLDEVMQLTITPGGPGTGRVSDNSPLPVQGNGSTTRLSGVVPVGAPRPAKGANILGARWEWTNWCGDARKPYFSFRPLSDGITYSYTAGPLGNSAICTDRSKPSVLQPLGPTTQMIETSQPR